MSYNNPVTKLNGCEIVSVKTPDGRPDGKALLINPKSGMGFKSIKESRKYAIRVSDEIDYEISFWLKQPSTDPSLSLSIQTFNAHFIETPTYNIKTALFERNFVPFNTQILSMPDTFQFVRFIVYSKNQKPNLNKQPKTSLAAGTNLVMSPDTVNMFVNLQCIHSKDSIIIWNFKVKPLRTPFSTGFIQSAHLLELWRKNNNKVLNNEQVDRTAQQFLLPYNTGQSVINL